MQDPVRPPYEIVEVPSNGDAALREQCYDVRIQVFVDEQGFPLDVEIDQYDETATHFLLRLTPSLKPVGTVRVVLGKNGSTKYTLGRLCILKEYRQFKWGRELVLALHEFVKKDAKRFGALDHVDVIGHSQIPVIKFYAKYGYIPEGDEFEEDGAPHQIVVARLSLEQ